MTTSYLFAYYTLDSQVSLSSCMSIKTGLFSFWFLLYHYSDFWYYKSLLYYVKFKKKSGENKNKLRTIYPKNHENFKNRKPRVQLYWFLQKRRVYKQNGNLTQTNNTENEQSEDLSVSVCVRVLCQMDQPMNSSISTLFFQSITEQLTHICSTTRNEENNAYQRPIRKKRRKSA